MNSLEIREQENLYLKKKNEQLVKEIIEIRSSRRKDQLDLDFMIRENFVAVEKMNRLRSLASNIDERSKECLKKIVECSTELTNILNFVKYMREVDVEYQTLHSQIIEGTPSNRSIAGPSINQSAQNEAQGSPQNLEITRRSIREERTVGEFTTRGGSHAVQYDTEVQNFEMEETGIDPEETNPDVQQSIRSARRGLSVIDEDPERSSYEDVVGTSGVLQQDVSTAFVNFLTKLPQVTVRRGENAENHEHSDSSIRVEPDSESSSLAGNPQDSDSNTTTTVRLSSSEKEPASPKSSFVKRKSLGSPHPRPVASTSRRNSFSHLGFMGSRSRTPSAEFEYRLLYPTHSLVQQDSTLTDASAMTTIKTPEKKTSSRYHRSTRATEHPPPSTSREAAECEEENTMDDINDLSSMVKNASTPLPVQNSGRLRSRAENKENSNPESTNRSGPVVELTRLDFSSNSSNPAKSNSAGRERLEEAIDKIKKQKIQNGNVGSQCTPTTSSTNTSLALRKKMRMYASSTDEHHSDHSRDDDDDRIPIVKRRRRNCTLNKRDTVVEEFLARNPGAILLEDKFGNSLRRRNKNTLNKSDASPNVSAAGSSKNWQPTVELARSDFSKNDEEDTSDAETAKSQIKPKHRSTSRVKQKSTSIPNKKKSRWTNWAESTDGESNNGRDCANEENVEQEDRQTVKDREYASSTESEASTQTKGKKRSRNDNTDKFKTKKFAQDAKREDSSAGSSERKPRRAVKNVVYKEPSLTADWMKKKLSVRKRLPRSCEKLDLR